MDYQINYSPSEVMELSKKTNRPITYHQAQEGLRKAISEIAMNAEFRRKLIGKALDYARNIQKLKQRSKND